MWILLIVLTSTFPYPKEIPPGSMRVVTKSKEDCMVLKEHIQNTWKFDRYRATVSCTFMGHFQ